MKQHTLRHEFVESFPDQLEEGILYISVRFAAATHKCACGCGNTVHTRLSPTDWKLTYDGRTVSLYPSIGNWSFPCQSHYWIRNDRITWSRQWTSEEIAEGRASDQRRKEQQYGEKREHKASLWRRIRKRF
jgi:hypothetical protein